MLKILLVCTNIITLIVKFENNKGFLTCFRVRAKINLKTPKGFLTCFRARAKINLNYINTI